LVCGKATDRLIRRKKVAQLVAERLDRAWLEPLSLFICQKLFDRRVDQDGALGLQAALKLCLDGESLIQ
jgi:hypothetical protein